MSTSMSSEERKCLEIELSLIEVEPIEASIQEHWDELWKNFNSKIIEEKKKVQILSTEILNWKKQILENENDIKLKEKAMKSSYQEQQELNIEVAAMKAENERNITITKSKLSTIVNNSNQHFNESKLMISKKSDDIVNLFHQFKKFNKEVEKNFALLVITKKQINIFLDKYFFVKNNGVPERLLLENYDADFKNIINDFLQIYGENKYHEILNSIKNFNNYKKNNDQQVVISNESKGNKLFDLEKLKLELGSIINLIPNY